MPSREPELDRLLPDASEVRRRADEIRARVADGRMQMVGASVAEPIALTEPSVEWANEYIAIRDRLAAALRQTAVKIEHVGSTSIPGIAAKPVIDVQVAVPDLSAEETFVPAIESVGPQLRMREPDRGHLYFRDNPRTIQIHVCQIGSTWERDHLLFRDYLRAHPDVARAYEEVKRAAVAKYGSDRLTYTEAKGPFIEGVLGRAEEWAREIGWQP